VPTLRCSATTTTWAKLHQLKELFGHRTPAQTMEQIVHEAHGHYLAPTGWSQDVSRAIKVLGRVKPALLIVADDVVKVAKTATNVDIWIRFESAPVTVSKQEWDR